MAVKVLEPTEERRDGSTPHGGAYSIARFSDYRGQPVPKAKAVWVEILEFDRAGNCIFRTYGELKPN